MWPHAAGPAPVRAVERRQDGLESDSHFEHARDGLERVDLEALDPVSGLTRKARGVVEGRRVGLGVEQIVDAQLQLQMLRELVAGVEIELAVALVLRELIAIADRIGRRACATADRRTTARDCPPARRRSR